VGEWEGKREYRVLTNKEGLKMGYKRKGYIYIHIYKYNQPTR